ncbi:hypothetical protein [Streptomyces sp. NPDC047999]|uniref:hypothetical protein n=1 Tax=unclassified Streptomyces TaxID=2593676 RepID=UPI003717A80F
MLGIAENPFRRHVVTQGAEEHHVFHSEVLIPAVRDDVVVLVDGQPAPAAAETGMLAQLPFDFGRSLGSILVHALSGSHLDRRANHIGVSFAARGK